MTTTTDCSSIVQPRMAKFSDNSLSLGRPDRSSSRMALVTGGARDLGWHYANDLARRGYGCVVTSRSADSAAQAAARLATAYPGQNFKGIKLDLARGPDDWTVALNALEKEGVQLHVAVLNAAVEWTGRFEDEDPAVLEGLLMANVTGMTMVSRWCVQHMKKQTGARFIVGCSAVSTFIRLHYGEVYCASRHYQSAFFSQLGARLKREGSNVRVCLAETSVVTTTALLDKMNAAAMNGEMAKPGEMVSQDQRALSMLQKVSLKPTDFCRQTLDEAFRGSRGPVVLGWVWRVARFVKRWTGMDLMFPATPRDREMYDGDTAKSTKPHWTSLK